MVKLLVLATLCLAASTVGQPNHPRNEFSNSYAFPFVARSAWGANPPRSVTALSAPVSYVVIHHTHVPGICLTRAQCMRDMRSMQNTHQNTNGWWDIGFNFAIGGEGSVYEGRGWEAVGAHAAGINAQSIGIAFIGDFVSQLPPAAAIESAKQLIAAGVQLGYIKTDYELAGHRKFSATECPGEALFREIQTWERYTDSYTGNNPFTFVTRAQWGANPPRSVTRMNTPVPYVVIHHTYIPAVCMTREQCMRDMRAMQNLHQNTNGWGDIGYSFAVGGEGSVYEGRGWEAVGAHAVGVNTQSIGIVFIGDYRTRLPTAVALQTVKQLITAGVRLGFIRADYKLVGHRQVTATECPGAALFREIQTWDRFSPNL